eukprot:scaffold14146_cov125-Isochrysis_galbana.AAC.3
MAGGRGSVRTAKGQKCPAVSPLPPAAAIPPRPSPQTQPDPAHPSRIGARAARRPPRASAPHPRAPQGNGQRGPRTHPQRDGGEKTPPRHWVPACEFGDETGREHRRQPKGKEVAETGTGVEGGRGGAEGRGGAIGASRPAVFCRPAALRRRIPCPDPC